MMKTVQTPPRPFLLVFALLTALLALLVFKGLVTGPPSVAQTKAAIGFDGDRAVARLARILGDQRPHPVDTDANDAVRERILAEVRSLGYTPEVRDDFACRGTRRWGGFACARVRNIVLRAGPAGGGAVLVAAHYDSVPAGPGAGDDGSGVAATLEIAALLQGRALKKPVIFLLTDGEEVGLLGAVSFVAKDPLAKDVVLAINMEARGTGGPAIMFQTSSPNARDITALATNSPRTIANSLAADIYRTLPNDTDATEFLGKKWDVLNFAFISPVARYHTPLDTLENLETASVAHMGGAALAAVHAHIGAGPATAPEGNVIYSDILGRFLLVLPVLVGWALLGFGFIAAGFRYFTTDKGGAVRALLAPIVAIGVAGGIGYGLLLAINALRVETTWWTANPMAARSLFYSTGILGGALGLWMCRGIAKERVIAGAWLWLSGLFLALSFVSQGAMILVAPAAGLYGIAVLATQFWKKAAFLHVAWIEAVLVLILPTLDFAEAGLGFEMGWAFGGLAGLLSFMVLATALTSRDVGGKPIAAFSAIVLAAGIFAFFTPAYSDKLPRPLNLQHWHDDAANHWLLSPADEPAPKAMTAIAPFALGPIKGSDETRLIAPTGPIPTSLPLPSIQVLSEVVTGATRTLKLRVSAPQADEVQLNVPAGAALTAIGSGTTLEASLIEFDSTVAKGLRCSGRSCVTWDITVVMGNTKTDWTISSTRRGQDPLAGPLLNARPKTASPIQGGDRRVSFALQKL
jgi:Peptidase family M28